MSQIRKLVLKKIKMFGDLFTNCIEYTKSIYKAETYDYVYDSYLEPSLKEVERIRRWKDLSGYITNTRKKPCIEIKNKT